MTDLRTTVIDRLRPSSPLNAAMLERARLVLEYSRGWPTIHVYCFNQYTYEQLRSDSVWPLIHDAIVDVIGRDFTLNFAGVREQAG